MKQTKQLPKTKQPEPVLVTTAHRGVFFGYIETRDETPEGLAVTLTNARCAIRWGTTGGFLELASKGPGPNGKVGARAPRVELRKVTSITAVAPEAVTAWERGP